MSPAVCPACGSTSTYTRKRDGVLCCTACGYGVGHRPRATKHECPLCHGTRVYALKQAGQFACRRCGFGQSTGVKPQYLAVMAEQARAEYRQKGWIQSCPVCGSGNLARLLDGECSCPTCGFTTKGSPLHDQYLAALPPFREVGPHRPTPAKVTLNGRTLALKLLAGKVWVVVQEADASQGSPGKVYSIPVYDATERPDLDIADPVEVARAWQQALVRAAAGQAAFREEFPNRLNGLTLEQIAGLQEGGLLSPNALDKVRAAFLQEMSPKNPLDLGYAAMAFEIGVLDTLDEELEAVTPLTILTPPAPAEDDDDDEIPPGGEENLYYPVPVPDDLPPADEVQISFDGGKTVWAFVASRRVSGGDE